MSRNTGKRLDKVEGVTTIYHEGPAGKFPTIDDFIDMNKDSDKPRSENIRIIYDDGAGVKRMYYVTSRGNLGYVNLT